ncbi:MAG TPA: Holliday junction branch migration protein RuvA [Polyangiaceae bacterium]|nr:Holliday junction branch migration protein RuvA [Polyangiaceae bacterium]
MIGRLVGKLVSDDVDGTVVIDVSGVGYEVTVPLGVVGRARDPSVADQLVLSIHTHSREDRLELYGFASEVERRVFRMLLTLPGIGPKLALSVLSALPPPELADAVRAGDLKRLGKISGVGKKTAERLVLELKEKLPKLGGLDATPKPPSPERPDDQARLLGALTNMGYKPAEAERAIERIKDRLGQDPISDVLRAALAELAR